MTCDPFRSLVERTRQAVCVVDDELRVTYASPTAATRFGFALGESFLAAVDPDHRGMVRRALANPDAGETVEFRLGGGCRWAEAETSDLRDVDGVAGVVVELRDTTEHRRLSDGLARSYLVEREAALRSRELEELRAGLLAAVSHDFRTPLTSIVGFGQLLRQHWDEFADDARLGMVDRLLVAADQLERRVADFLEISRMESASVTLDTASLPLSEVVEAALERSEIVLAGHSVEVALPPGVAVLADVEATGRVMDNLLGNAAKYAPAGSTITISADHVEGFVRLSVADAGPGVAADDRERVFEPFVRTPGARRASRGAGVGLAVVRRLVEAQGGAVWIDDTERGARFTIALPLAVVDEVSDVPMEVVA